MADSKQGKRGLGRGLSALMADVRPSQDDSAATPRSVQTAPIEKLFANPNQPRRRFDQESLRELADSIREKGVLQPLIVRKHPTKTNGYEIVAGERRWRAAQIAQMHELPIILREFSDDEVLEIAIIENVQRADLNPVEEAIGYRQLMERFGHTQAKLAEALSKSRSHIANMLRLLQLPEDVQDLLASGKLSAGHARALITSENASELARQIVEQGLSVRETEALTKAPRKPARPRTARPAEKDADTRALEADLAANIGMKVSIDHNADGSGAVTLRYKDMDQLDELCRLLSSGL